MQETGNGVLHEAGDGHRPYAARDRGDCSGNLGDIFEIHISAELTRLRVTIHPDVDYNGAGFYHVGSDHFGAAGGDDEDIGLTGDGGHVYGAGVAGCDGGVGVKEHFRDGKAHDVAPADYDGPLALGVHADGLQQLHDAGGGAGSYVRGFLPEPGDVEGVEAVHVLFAGDGLDDAGFGDLLRQGKLDQDAVYGVVLVEGAHEVKEFVLGGCIGKDDGAVADAHGLAGLFLVADVNHAGGVFTHAHDHQVRNPSVLLGEGCNLLFYFLFQCR